MWEEKFNVLFFWLQQSRMDYAEIEIDQRFHKHIIGKGGANSEYMYL